MAFSFFDKLFGIKLKDKEPEVNNKTFLAPEREGAIDVITGTGYGSIAYTFNIEEDFHNEIEIINRYRELATVADCDNAISEIVDESIVSDEINSIVKINLDAVDIKEKVKNKISEEYDYLYYLLDFEKSGYDLFKKWYIDGRLYLNKIFKDGDINGKQGIQAIQYLDPRRIKKIREIDKQLSTGTEVGDVKVTDEYYLYNEVGFMDAQRDYQVASPLIATLKIHVDNIAYIHSGIFSPDRTMIYSNLHKAIKPLNQLSMVEDAVAIYRLVRAPEKRIFNVDVGNLPTKKAEEFLTQQMNKHKNKIVYDSTTGEVKTDKKFSTMIEDYWFPKRDGGKGTSVETLPGAQNLSEVSDLLYYQDKFYKSLNVPVSRIKSDDTFNLGRASEITRDEIKFSKFIKRLRQQFAELFHDLLQTQLLAKGVISSKSEYEEIKQDIKFVWNNDSYYAELKELEMLKDRVAVVKDMEEYVGKYYSSDFVRKNILKLTDEDMDQIEKENDNDEAPNLYNRPIEELPPNLSDTDTFKDKEYIIKQSIANTKMANQDSVKDFDLPTKSHVPIQSSQFKSEKLNHKLRKILAE